ncbi:hypothetical protein ACFPM7_01395 [Actinokineospora guangxiensis]|uniref:Uncharacterized protein n=1 Tax=Actinokineospora guangxiensis TaxID=1490288 RepID=A0ABW0EHG6_9PSEU
MPETIKNDGGASPLGPEDVATRRRMTAEQRVGALESAANDELTAAGVPSVRFRLDPATARYARFDAATWVALVEPSPFDPATAEALTEDERGRVAGTIYHEARHAEQWFEIARLLAGLHGFDAARIAEEMTIPEHVAEAAAADPTTRCTLNNGRAFAWYESVYGGDFRPCTEDSADPPRRAVGSAAGDLTA